MIQRIQSVYLLLVTALLVAALCLPLGSFVDSAGIHEFRPLGVAMGDGYQRTWGLFCLLLLSALVAFTTIFLFRNRILQIRMTIFNSLLLIGYYLSFGAFYWALRGNASVFDLHWAAGFPLVCLVLNYLAIRAIGRDEVMVKAADRLR